MSATTYNKGWSEGAWGYNGWSGIAPAYVVDGVSGTGDVGSVTILVIRVVYVDGVEGSGLVNAVVTQANSNVFPTGISASGAVGTVSTQTNDVVIPTGVSATGAVGTVKIFGWTVVNDYQDATWVEVDVAA